MEVLDKAGTGTANSSGEDSLRELYGQWRGVTLEERESLQRGDWGRVAAQQERKRVLRERLQRAGLERGEVLPWEKEVLAELVELERENLAAVQEAVRYAQREDAELEASLRRLRQVKRSYARLERGGWQAFS